ncbi:hypothetical protein EJ06DRAFT_523760 [Trichodelitschia bisporula]|uniref:Uncharacterized protein n=1 Tax=Trichodelitschia bisporula TaxID=703511 RepID=A0A6G1HPD8_9PEZI|nr:hypothetical protein EJ06DRAFT_523760 [Trichodelitschia bisporula]
MARIVRRQRMPIHIYERPAAVSDYNENTRSDRKQSLVKGTFGEDGDIRLLSAPAFMFDVCAASHLPHELYSSGTTGGKPRMSEENDDNGDDNVDDEDNDGDKDRDND